MIVTNNTSDIVELQRVTSDLLFCHDHPGKLRQAAQDLFALFSRLSGYNDDPTGGSDLADKALPAGKALGFADAGRCVLDFARTSKFLRGTFIAIKELQRRFPQQQLNILYAGCGPFATLASPLTTQFSSKEIRFTLLDVNGKSLESAEKVIDAFGARSFVDELIQADATTYTWPGNQPLHMVISETMQRALEREPQLPVMANLAPQLCQDGLFIPQKIAVDAHLCELGKEFALINTESGVSQFERVRVNLCRLMELTAENAAALVSTALPDEDNVASVACSAIELPQEFTVAYRLMLSTEVTVFPPVVLKEYDSAITLPLVLSANGLCAGSNIEFRYCLGRNPGFKYRAV